MRDKQTTKTLKADLSHLAFFPGSMFLTPLLHPFPEWCKSDGNRGCDESRGVPHCYSFFLWCAVPPTMYSPSQTTPESIFSPGYSPSEIDFSSVGFPLGTAPARKSVPEWALLCVPQLPWGHIHLLCCGVLHGLQMEICSKLFHHGLQSLPYHGLPQGL